MNTLDSEQHIEREPDETQIMTFEEAEAIIEAGRPEGLKRMETVGSHNARRGYHFHFIAAKLLEEGETRPLIVDQADVGDGIKPLATKTLAEWRGYWYQAAKEREGIAQKCSV